MINNNPQTLLRIGLFDGSLDEAVQRCANPLTKTNIGAGNTIKYVAFGEREALYFLMVSQQIEKRLSFPGYNTVLTVTSRFDARNQQVADQFERETGIRLNVDAPEFLRKHYELMSLLFESFEENPERYMAAFRG